MPDLTARTWQRWTQGGAVRADGRPAAVRPGPSHALTEDEHQAVLETTPRQARRPHTSLTNNFTLAARTIADIYKARWQIELFFI